MAVEGDAPLEVGDDGVEVIDPCFRAPLTRYVIAAEPQQPKPNQPVS
jgi:hypothetical protein